ncbi:recombinase family protein [Priestia megaterium]|uniref:recombinase family protein n=1 Tax=Priestia megaterium TaxID=1404 RepID=UPI0039C37B24
MKFGYVRVSPTFENLDVQINTLEQAGCEKIFTERITDSIKERPVLEEIIRNIRQGVIKQGDIICVYKLDRLSRTRKHIFELHDLFKEYGIHLESVHENIDTTTHIGRSMFGMLAIVAELEKEMKRERTISGLKVARARGREGGRPRVDDKKISKALEMYDSQDFTVNEIITITGIAKATFYKYLKKRQEK